MKSHLTKSAVAAALLLAVGAACANDYTAPMKAKKYAEVEKIATAKLALEPGNAEAMVAKVDAILAAGSEARIEETIKLAEQCIAANPVSAICHLAQGNALGSKAMAGGMMSAMSYAGKIRDAYKKAVELDPRNLEARFSLLQFYTMAPSFMGGGTSKAESLVAQTATINPEAGKLMAASIDAAEGRVAKAEAAAAAAHPGADQELQDRHESLYGAIAGKYMSDKKYADGERVVRDGLKRYSDSDSLPYLLARTQQGQGKHREAVALFEQVWSKNPGAHVQYRMGQSLQALGEKPRAMAAYEKALSFKPTLNKKMRADAEDQVKALKG